MMVQADILKALEKNRCLLVASFQANAWWSLIQIRHFFDQQHQHTVLLCILLCVQVLNQILFSLLLVFGSTMLMIYVLELLVEDHFDLWGIYMEKLDTSSTMTQSYIFFWFFSSDLSNMQAASLVKTSQMAGFFQWTVTKGT